MPTPKRGPRLGSGPSHQRHLLAGLATELFRHGRIRTTVSRAKMLRPYAEKLVTKAKKGDLAARREVLKTVHDREVVAHLFDDIAPRFADRDGGYTRILKLGPRAGDNAPMALIELVVRADESAAEVIEERKVARSRGLFGRRRRKEALVVAELDHDDHEGHDHGDLMVDDDELDGLPDVPDAGDLDEVLDAPDEAAAEASDAAAVEAKAIEAEDDADDSPPPESRTP